MAAEAALAAAMEAQGPEFVGLKGQRSGVLTGAKPRSLNQTCCLEDPKHPRSKPVLVRSSCAGDSECRSCVPFRPSRLKGSEGLGFRTSRCWVEGFGSNAIRVR